MVDKDSELFKDLVERINKNFYKYGYALCPFEVYGMVKSYDGISYPCGSCDSCPHRIRTLKNLKKEITKDISIGEGDYKHFFIRRKFKSYDVNTSIRLSDSKQIAEYILGMTEEDLEKEVKKEVKKSEEFASKGFFLSTEDVDTVINQNIAIDSVSYAQVEWVRSRISIEPLGNLEGDFSL